MYFVLLHRKNLEKLVKILNGSTLICLLLLFIIITTKVSFLKELRL